MKVDQKRDVTIIRAVGKSDAAKYICVELSIASIVILENSYYFNRFG